MEEKTIDEIINGIVKKAVRETMAEVRAEEKRDRQKKAAYETKRLMESYADMKRYIEEETSEERKETELLVARMERAMQELKEQCEKKGIAYKYNAFKMRYIKQMTYEEIAAELNCGKNSPAMWTKQMIRKMAVKMYGARSV